MRGMASLKPSVVLVLYVALWIRCALHKKIEPWLPSYSREKIRTLKTKRAVSPVRGLTRPKLSSPGPASPFRPSAISLRIRAAGVFLDETV